VKIILKKNSKLTKALVAISFFITIIAIFTPVMAVGSNRVSFIAIGDDLDINATNLIVGRINFGKDDELPSVKAVFHQRIYDDSGKKVYTMMGMLNDGYLINTSFSFFCPLYKVWFINVWQIMGTGKFKTTDNDITVYFRDLSTITMPNTKGKFVSAQILMLLSPTAEYRNGDPITGPAGPVLHWEGGSWALAAVIWYVPEIEDVLPIGPLSYLTKAWGI
jgi:hypothetical protein